VGLRAAWRELSAEHRRWLFLNAVLITAFINAALNALIAWGSAAGEDEIPLWAAPLVGGPSTITDTVGTFFILPLVTTLLITTVIWHERDTGRLERLVLADGSDTFFRRLPRTRFRRGLYFGALCTLILAPAAVIVLAAIDFGDISVGDFVLYKTIFGIVLGLIVTPVIGIAAITDDRSAEEKKLAVGQLTSP
jgi:hypothetical protein